MAARGAGAAARADAAHRRASCPARADDPECKARVAAFLQALQRIGLDRRPQRADRRPLGRGRCRRAFADTAAELVALAPDVILAHGSSTVGPLQQATRTVPIVFADVADPVGGGLVASLARPGGNATGFITSEFGFSGKWLELLKQIAPGVTRVAVLRDSAITPQIGMFGGIQAVAPSLGVELRPIDCATSARSSAPSRHSRAHRMAG